MMLQNYFIWSPRAHLVCSFVCLFGAPNVIPKTHLHSCVSYQLD